AEDRLGVLDVRGLLLGSLLGSLWLLSLGLCLAVLRLLDLGLLLLELAGVLGLQLAVDLVLLCDLLGLLRLLCRDGELLCRRLDLRRTLLLIRLARLDSLGIRHRLRRGRV